MLVIRSAKGGKDRFVPIPCSLVTELQAQIAIAKAVSESDRLNRIPVKLPGLLATKYPHWQFSPKWAWLFPSRVTCADPRTGTIVRWRCHEANVQRAVKAAARPLGLDITPHHLRHSYATHCLNAGTNVRAIQEVMGHKHLDTTQGYLHAETVAVQSSLDCASSFIIHHS
jgi:integrase